MNTRTKAFGLLTGLLVYSGLSSWCFLARDVSFTISPALACPVIGPSSLLLWGGQALPWFLGISLALAACVVGATFRQSLRPKLIMTAVVIWLAGGFLPYAVSI
ncbi:MAG: hypothetical protein HZC54_10610 [Verrucomicrobia bacterium]|nr:hypothetical protein [Verrucomicrobiota bacterium]